MDDKDKSMWWWGWLTAAVIASAAWPSMSVAIGVDWVFWVGLVVIWVVFIVPLALKVFKAAKEK